GGEGDLGPAAEEKHGEVAVFRQPDVTRLHGSNPLNFRVADKQEKRDITGSEAKRADRACSDSRSARAPNGRERGIIPCGVVLMKLWSRTPKGGFDFKALRRNVWNPAPIDRCPMIACRQED